MCMGCARQKKMISQLSIENSALKMHKSILSYFFHFDNVAFKNVLML